RTPLRNMSNTFPETWQHSTSSLSCRKPAPPLTVWKPRKIALSRSMSSGRLSSSTSCSDSCSRISPASTRKSCRISSSASTPIQCPLKPKTGKQIIDVVLTLDDIRPFIGMDLRTFTLRGMFLLFELGPQLRRVMLDAGEMVDLAGHAHQLDQVVLDLGDQADEDRKSTRLNSSHVKI